MYHTILVPVSFEEDRDNDAALRVAQTLRATDGTITLLHVMEKIPTYAGEFLPQDFRTRQMAEIRASLSARADGIADVEVDVVEGHSGRTIVQEARDRGIDCIVMASHAPGMQDLLLGSTATHVVRHAACAVHVLR